MLLNTINKNWFSHAGPDILSGMVVALSLVPESLAFAMIAGVDPKVAIYASFAMATVISFVGGRKAMISAATGSMSLLMGTLVKDYGLQYLIATTLLTGVLQILIGYFKLGNLMRFVSHSVITGFLNALAILLFIEQLPKLIHVTWHVYVMTALGLAIIYFFPYATKKVPASLICIIVLTILSVSLHLHVPNVGDLGTLPHELPHFVLPHVPYTLHTLNIILPYAIALAIVGLLESLMTASILDDLTDEPSDKNKECRGQGIANIINGFLGGMAGCALIGQSMINVKSGGRSRLSTLVTGCFLLIVVIFFNKWVSLIPTSALVAIMIMVAITTFSWSSIIHFHKMPITSNITMLCTVIIVLFTHNLAYGVFVGVLLSALFYTHKVAKSLSLTTITQQDGETKTYTINGQVFFASANKFINGFNFNDKTKNIIINVEHAHFWDITSIKALDNIILKYKKREIHVDIIGANNYSKDLIDKYAKHLS